MTIEVPESRWADLDGPVHYVEWDGPAERTFVLVHGLGGSSLSWLAVGPRLARHGRVFALDLGRFRADASGGPQQPTVGQPEAGLSIRGGGRGRRAGRALRELDGRRDLDAPGRGRAGIGRRPRPFELGLPLGARGIPGAGGDGGVRPLPTAAGRRLGLAQAHERPRRRASGPDRVPDHRRRPRQDRPRPRATPRRAAPSPTGERRRRAGVPRSRAVADGARTPPQARGVDPGLREVSGAGDPRTEDRLVPLRYAESALAGHPGWEMRLLPKVGHVPQMETPERWLAAVEDWMARVGPRSG